MRMEKVSEQRFYYEDYPYYWYQDHTRPDVFHFARPTFMPDNSRNTRCVIGMHCPILHVLRMGYFT